MIDLRISESCAAELRRALAVEQASTPRPTPEPTPTPPAQPPTIDWQSRVYEAAARQGYSPVTLYEWDWSLDTGHVDFSTVQANGVIVVTFVPTGPAEHNNLAQIDIIGYPVSQHNSLVLSLSSQPVDFAVSPPAISRGDAPTIPYGVGTVGVQWWSQLPTAVALVPGQRYYLNATGRDSYDPSDSRGGGIRIHLRKPQGH